MEIKFYHKQFLVPSVPMSIPLIGSIRQFFHERTGSQWRVRRSLTWGVLMGMKVSVQEWRLVLGRSGTVVLFGAGVGLNNQKERGVP